MIKLCPPSLWSLAIFTAIVILDITNKNYKQIFFHIVTGLFAVLGLSVLCQYAGETTSWAIFSIPFVVLVVGFLLIWIDGRKDPVPQPKASCQTPTPKRACPCLGCRRCPCSCGMNIPAPPPPVGPAPSCNPLPDSVTSLPPRKPESSLGCPPKN